MRQSHWQTQTLPQSSIATLFTAISFQNSRSCPHQFQHTNIWHNHTHCRYLPVLVNRTDNVLSSTTWDTVVTWSSVPNMSTLTVTLYVCETTGCLVPIKVVVRRRPQRTHSGECESRHCLRNATCRQRTAVFSCCHHQSLARHQSTWATVKSVREAFVSAQALPTGWSVCP